MVKNVIRYLGEANAPQDVRRRRRQVMDGVRRVGTPALVKHMYTVRDKENGVAVESPNFDDIYQQTRHDDPLSYGTGFVSVETSNDEWVTPEGELVVGTTVAPSPGSVPAPRFRGYGPGYLTYVSLPDVSTDFFKLSEAGVLIRVQTATAQMGWFPSVSDNDLLIRVEIDQRENIIATYERYQLKQTNPATVRGLDRGGRRERDTDYGNQHLLNQKFELTLVPTTDILYSVETDR